MIVGTRYINNAVLYTMFKNHYCPNCNKRLILVKKSRIVNSHPSEAKNFEFNLGAGFVEGMSDSFGRSFDVLCAKKNFQLRL